jgi:RND family efflux transporter MFP subunit
VEVVSETLHEQAVLSGTTEAPHRAELSTRVDGLVTELLVDEGTVVAEDEPILVLDARLAELEADAAAARVEEAEARHRDAIRVRDELLSLKKGRHASEAEIESAVAAVDIAAAALAAERAALARAREIVYRHRLTAPFSGMVVARNVEVGEWVQRDEAAVEIVALDRMRVRAQLPQRDYVRVLPGAAASLRFDALPERDVDGEVLVRVASGDPRSRSFPVLIDLPNPKRLLAPGMSARVRIDLAAGPGESGRASLTVPRDAVVAKSDGSREEVVAGELAAGDRVVLLGNERLRPGQTVAPQGDDTATAALR